MSSKAFGWLVGLLVVACVVVVAGIGNGWFGMGRQGRVAVRPETESKVDNQPTVDPIWQSATDGSNVEKIKRVGEYGHRVLQGETVVLAAEAEPGMPVTFFLFAEKGTV